MERDNIHSENQPKGSARNLSDTLDREDDDVGSAQRNLAKDDDGEQQAPKGKSPMEDAGADGGTGGTGGTNHEQDR